MQLLHKDILGKDKDFVMSGLRREINHLQEVLASVESEHKIDVIYISKYLKFTETKLKSIRKFLGDWT